VAGIVYFYVRDSITQQGTFSLALCRSGIPRVELAVGAVQIIFFQLSRAEVNATGEDKGNRFLHA
jgi:hypothetical protein